MSLSDLIDENGSASYWNKFLQGDTHAFEKLMQENYHDLFHYGARFTKDKELVKDCIQDLFLVLWKNRSSISKTEFVKYYLLKALRRKLSKRLNGHDHSAANHSSVNIELHFDAGFDDPIEIKIIQWENYSHLSKKIRNLLADPFKKGTRSNFSPLLLRS